VAKFQADRAEHIAKQAEARALAEQQEQARSAEEAARFDAAVAAAVARRG